MSTTRQDAHLAIRELWEVANKRLQEPDAETKKLGETAIREVETEGGATITEMTGRLIVRAAFEKPDGTCEDIEVDMPEDIRDLSESEVWIDWSRGEAMGTYTPPIRQFPALARELQALI